MPVSSAGYKPLPQVPPAEPSSSSAFPSRNLSSRNNDQEEHDFEAELDEGEEEIALRNLDLQNRHQRPRSSYSPQTPTIYEEDIKQQNGHMSGIESDSESAYGGGGMRGVASDFTYGTGANLNAPAKEGRRGDRTALYVALVRPFRYSQIDRKLMIKLRHLLE